MVRLSAPDRRAALIEATVAVMIEKGFAGATTRDVAARLGIGRGLIHHYFDTWQLLQREAFVAVSAAARDEIAARMAALAQAQRLDVLLEALVADPALAHWRLFADAWDEAQRDPDLARVHGEIGAWWRQLVARTLTDTGATDTSAADAAWRLTALADGLSAHLLLAEPTLSRDAAVRLLRDAARMERGPARA